MIVFGGTHAADETRNDGAAYDPKKDTWRSIATSPLAVREHHTAVWTGAKMVVFGGEDHGTVFGDGAAYDPVSNTWKKIATSPLGVRRGHSAVWTGKEMLVLGEPPVFGVPEGASYDPIKDSWTNLPETPLSATSDLKDFIFAWTGTTAAAISGDINDNAAIRFDGVARKWTSLPKYAEGHSFAGFAVSGSKLFVFGGLSSSPTSPFFKSSSTGLLIDDSSTVVKVVAAPPVTVMGRSDRTAANVWCSMSTCFVWSGGVQDADMTLALVGGGAAFDLASETWKAMPTEGEPLARGGASTVWTGSLAIVWGGSKGLVGASDGGVYVP
jgi:N-acetylneuraminic acid mutarotase